MFNSYEEAKVYAMERSKKDSNYVGIPMTKNGKYNVAKDWDEVEYAESFGWSLVKY